MTRPSLHLTALLTLTLILAGCGGFRDSKLNPFNWFGRSEETEKVALPERPRDTRAAGGDGADDAGRGNSRRRDHPRHRTDADARLVAGRTGAAAGR